MLEPAPAFGHGCPGGPTINRINTPEAYADCRAGRIAGGVALLSLDSVRPVYLCLALEVRSPASSQALLRKTIKANRRAVLGERSALMRRVAEVARRIGLLPMPSC